jgi:hypothetical protein
VLGTAAGAWFDTLDLGFSEVEASISMLPGDTVAITGFGSDLRIDPGQPTRLDPVRLTTTHCYAGGGRWFFIEIHANGHRYGFRQLPRFTASRRHDVLSQSPDSHGATALQSIESRHASFYAVPGQSQTRPTA